MATLYVLKKDLEKRKQEKEQCLNFLYHIEDVFDYDYEIISKCIDELQNLEIKEDNRFEVINNGTN